MKVRAGETQPLEVLRRTNLRGIGCIGSDDRDVDFSDASDGDSNIDTDRDRKTNINVEKDENKEEHGNSSFTWNMSV